MFLLILVLSSPKIALTLSFTFHNVSINSSTRKGIIKSKLHLHSTMFLLILWQAEMRLVINYLFTFHNVSINSLTFPILSTVVPNLHSTMFLLIPVEIVEARLFNSNLHSTMFLLILQCYRYVRGSSQIYIPQCFY